MRRMPWVVYGWPGLPQLWLYGSWGGLGMALAAGVVLDLLLLASYGWSELIGQDLRNTVWAVCGVAWLIAVACSAWQCRRMGANADVHSEGDVFGQGVSYYLRGDYFQAERSFDSLLRRNARDLDARLMLATLMRHTGRLDEATRQLDTLVRFDGAAKWQLEIENERDLLAKAKAQPATAGEPVASTCEGQQDGIARAA